MALRTNLVKRGVKLKNTKCFFCRRVDEDGSHLFVRCKAIKEVWRAMNLENVRMKLEEITSLHAVMDLLWGLDEKVRVQILTFWSNWWMRGIK